MTGHGIRLNLFIITAILISLAYASAVHACTTFVLGDRGHQLFGRNYDFDFGDGYVMVNKKGVIKKAYPAPATVEEKGQPASWTSRFGSVTFNQFGREFPQGGMNEAGLIIETMSLKDTRNPDPDSRPYVRSANLWRQYILDTCASVGEVVESDSKIRISYDASKGIGAHFLVLDKEGGAAAIELLDGKMVVHRGESLPMRVLTNSTYEESISYWKRGNLPFIDVSNSIERFTTAANLVRDHKPGKPDSDVEYAFGILDAVKASQTRWSIVYDNREMKIYFRTDSNPQMRVIEAKEFDYSCKKPVQVLNMHSDLAGDVTDRFEEYTSEININLTSASFTKLGTRVKVSPQVVELMGKYPEQSRCGE